MNAIANYCFLRDLNDREKFVSSMKNAVVWILNSSIETHTELCLHYVNARRDVGYLFRMSGHI